MSFSVLITSQLIFCLSSLYLLANAFLPLLPVKFSVLAVISNPCHCNLFLPSKKSIYLLEDLLQSLNESQGPQLPYLTCELLESMQQPCLPSRGGAVYYSPATAGGGGWRSHSRYRDPTDPKPPPAWLIFLSVCPIMPYKGLDSS